MKDFFKNPITISALIILVIIAIWYFGFKNNMQNIPNSFTSRNCGGTTSFGETKYYKENGKYYSITNPNLQAVTDIRPREVSKQDYIIAYKESKTPCDPNLPQI